MPESEKLISSEKEKIRRDYASKLNQYSIQKRMWVFETGSEKSGALNQYRIEKMGARNKCVEGVQEDTISEVVQYFACHQKEYKGVLKQLIVQVGRTTDSRA